MTTTTTAAPVDLAASIKANLPAIKERVQKEGRENVNAIITDVLGPDAPQYVDEQAIRQKNRDMARQIAENERRFAKGEYASNEGPEISFPEGLVAMFSEAEMQRRAMEEESVEPHHLLLGMAEDPTSVLSKLGVSKAALLAAVEKEKQKPQEDDDKDETWSESLAKEDLAEYISKLSTEAPPELSIDDEVDIVYDLFYAP
jgi:ATP-dependent Clp protease ATP-binding subunit ClpA